MKYFKLKNILLVLLILLIGIQVFSIDKTPPQTIASEDLLQSPDMPEDVKMMLKNACADCHTNNTKYPWYTNIEPLSWWIKGHIDHGRENLNFSKWYSYNEDRKNHKADECVEVLEQRRMPFSSYIWMHSEAKLSDAEHERLISYFESLKS